MTTNPSNEQKTSNSFNCPLRVGRYNLRDLVFYEGVRYSYVEAEVHKPDPYPFGSLVLGIWASAYTLRKPTDQEEKERKDWEKIAYELGEKIALFQKRKITILNGAPSGLSQDLARGAARKGCFVAGITAADGTNSHSMIVGEKVYTEQKWTHNVLVYPHLTYDLPVGASFLEKKEIIREELIDRLKLRNPLNVQLSDASISLEGSWGTLYETTMSLHPNWSISGLLTPNAKKTIRQIEESGKWYLGDVIKIFNDYIGIKKNQYSQVIASDDPGELIEKVYDACVQRHQFFMTHPKYYHPARKSPFEKRIISRLIRVMNRNI